MAESMIQGCLKKIKKWNDSVEFIFSFFNKLFKQTNRHFACFYYVFLGVTGEVLVYLWQLWVYGLSRHLSAFKLLNQLSSLVILFHLSTQKKLS
jgi:hypothetical protein